MLRFVAFGILVLLTSGVWCLQLETETTSGLGEITWDVIVEKVDRYILPLMPFWYEELDPQITEPELTAHHMGEHNVYKSYMNIHLKEWRAEEPDNKFARESILRIMQNLDKIPEKYRTVLRNNGGGFINHCFYFGILSPNDNATERSPTGELLEDINAVFGDLEGLKKEFFQGMRKLFGSGYVWLSRTPGAKRPNLAVSITSNQDSPVSQGLHPILVLDLWEHAYYIKHNYRKWDHLKDFWTVVDWESVNKLDQWWKNLDKEEKEADKRIDEQRQGIEKRMKEEAAKKAKAEKEAEEVKKAKEAKAEKEVKKEEL